MKMNMSKVKDVLKAAKALVALVGGILTAASSVWVDNPYITFGLAVVTAITVFYTKNAKTIDSLLNELGTMVPQNEYVVVEGNTDRIE